MKTVAKCCVCNKDNRSENSLQTFLHEAKCKVCKNNICDFCFNFTSRCNDCIKKEFGEKE
jgi:hypothetical protein